MTIVPLLQIALRALRANKVRSGLTILGMVIGITSIIIIFSAGEGIKGLVLSQIESFGTDIIETEIKVPSSKKGTASEHQSASALVQGVQVTTLSLEDMDDISKLPNVKNAYAGIMGQEQVSYGNEMKKAMILGLSASYIDIDKSEIGEGRFYTESEDKSLARVVVLGAKMKEKLFGESDAIGKSVKIRKSKFRVIGIMKKRGAMMSFDFDDLLYIPIRTLQKRVMGIDHVLYMVHQLHDLSIIDETAEEARTIIRANHNIPEPETKRTDWTDTGRDDFRVVTMQESMEIFEKVTSIITMLLLSIIAVSLVVGGVGILNIMYVVVSERTSEIGLRKAVGATYKDIMVQFLVESILITFIAGLIGIILGVLISLVVALGAKSYGLDWRFGIPIKAFVTAILFSTVFGILFGVYPARKAARMEPVEALRSE